MKKINLTLNTLIIVSIFSACATSPTGRKQLMILPDSQMNSMGAQSFDQMKGQTPIERDSNINQYVKCVAMAVAKEASEAANVDNWEVVVFKDNTANAFALPGGKIGVHTGILPVAKTPGQLAAVLGHEVGHVIARHGNERVSQGLVTQGGMAAVASATKDSASKTAVLAGLGLGAQFGVLLPFSRKHESEADLIGLELMAKAGFNPGEASELWKNMSAGGGKQPPQWMSTHPSHETRIKDLESAAPKMMPDYERAKAAGKNPNCHM